MKKKNILYKFVFSKPEINWDVDKKNSNIVIIQNLPFFLNYGKSKIIKQTIQTFILRISDKLSKKTKIIIKFFKRNYKKTSLGQTDFEIFEIKKTHEFTTTRLSDYEFKINIDGENFDNYSFSPCNLDHIKVIFENNKKIKLTELDFNLEFLIKQSAKEQI